MDLQIEGKKAIMTGGSAGLRLWSAPTFASTIGFPQALRPRQMIWHPWRHSCAAHWPGLSWVRTL